MNIQNQNVKKSNMEKTMYDVNSYTDEELYSLLDLVNPTDRILEAKIIQMIQKYNRIYNDNGIELTNFFKNVYKRFFIDDNENDNETEEEDNIISNIEGFDVKLPDNNDDTKKNINNGKDIIRTTPIEYTKDKLNPLLKQTTKRIISIDSQFRGPLYPMSTDFTFNLSEPLKDVVGLSLSSVQIPYTWYTVTNSYGANYFYLKGNSDGIDNGNFDYKIEILAGNYSPDLLITEINKSINIVKGQNPEVYFGSTNLQYNSATNLTTTTIEIRNIFNETNYYLEFETNPLIYVNEDTTISDFNRKNNDNNIGGYFGFNYQQYLPNTIYSSRDLPAPIYTLSSSPYHIDPSINGLFIKDDGTIPKIITDGDYANESNTEQYYIDNSNNYFNIILYQGPDNYNINSVIIKNIEIKLNLENATYTRQQITNEINNKLISVSSFMSNSIMTTEIGRNYINDPSMVNFKSSYFYLIVNWDKTQIPNNKTDLKTIVIFPDETNLQNTTTVWVKDTGLRKPCCFNFTKKNNELNNIVGETPSLETNYVINNGPYIELSCIETGYTNEENTYKILVGNSRPSGYSLIEYINTINDGIMVINNATKKYNYNNENAINGILSNSKIENTDKINIYFDILKKFDNQYYYLNFDINNDCFLSSKNMIMYQFETDEFGNILLNNEIPVEQYGSLNVIDLSMNSKIVFNIEITNSFRIEETTFMQIIPKPGNHNSYAGVWNIPVNDVLRGVGIIQISKITEEMQNTLRNFQDYHDSFPFKNSVVNAKYYSTGENSVFYTIYITLNINKTLTQNSYKASFKETTSNDFYNSTWYKYLKIADSSYNLVDYDVKDEPYSLISGTETVLANKLTLNHPTTIKIIPYTNGLISKNNTNTINVTIPNGSYTKEELFNIINTQFTNNKVTEGSKVTNISIGGINYILFKLNINKIYTADDYSIVFYDLNSFVKCYLGVKSVKNVTWDSTLGWIIGYHSQTEYNLSEVVGDIKILLGDSTIITNIYNYFLIRLDDYTQSNMNDGLVTLTNTENNIPLPSYAYLDDFQCDPLTGEKIFTGTVNNGNETKLTQSQIYSAQQIANEKKNKVQKYSKGVFARDIFALLPVKVNGMKNGDTYVEFGGTLQNQQRVYFGPVNISRLTIQLLNDRGDVVDLNNASWSFSFICEQLYQQKSI
jgi:hypothetical protein